MSIPLVSAIVSTLPALLELANRLLKKANKTPLPEISGTNTESQLRAVIDRLQYFEGLEIEQAQLLKQVVEQVQNMGLALNHFRNRANLATGLASVALLVAVGTFFAYWQA